MVPLETGAGAALAFNSGMAAIMTSLLTVLRPDDTVVLYGAHLRRHAALHSGFLSIWGVHGIPCCRGQLAMTSTHAIPPAPTGPRGAGGDAGQSDPRMTDIARCVKTAGKRPPARW